MVEILQSCGGGEWRAEKDILGQREGVGAFMHSGASGSRQSDQRAAGGQGQLISIH